MYWYCIFQANNWGTGISCWVSVGPSGHGWGLFVIWMYALVLGPNCPPCKNGQSGPGAQLSRGSTVQGLNCPGAKMSRAQLSALKKWTVTPETCDPLLKLMTFMTIKNYINSILAMFCTNSEAQLFPW